MKQIDITKPLPTTALDQIILSSGSHDDRGAQVCVMEAVAWVAGEPHSDHPQCACPVITKFLVSWNDSLPTDADRERLLKPLIPEIIGTRASEAVEEKRSQMAMMWFIQEYTPAWLDLAGLQEEAAALRAEPTLENCRRAQEKAAAAWAAAWAAARAAARAAAWAAARAAAWAAAWDAAWAAAWDAAWAAAGTTAKEAAWEKLLPTVTTLQESAVALVRRMIAEREVVAV